MDITDQMMRLGSRGVYYPLVTAWLSFSTISYAAPDGASIVGGTGSITTNNLTTTINQNTQSMAIDWHSYNLNPNEIVNYLQPNSSSLSLNRILGGSASQIHGQINANGQVILVNPNGLFFGQDASINVGGLIASGLDINPVDFMNGDYIFNEVIGTDGLVVNSGLINASLGGSVTLLGRQVQNKGVINAKLGAVNLAAGKEAVLTFDNQGLIGVRISKEILQDELGIDPAVINSGEINAGGGRVLLTGSVSRDVFSEAVNHDGLEQATSVVVHEDGSFTLGGGANVSSSGAINVSTETGNAGQVVILGENINHSGSIHADATNGSAGNIELHAMDKTELRGSSVISAQAQSSGQGGDIKLLGDKIGLFDFTEVNASGSEGGGEILIGGDRQGLNSKIRNAEFLYIGHNSKVFADALGDGDGGRIIAYADDTGRFYGRLYARGGLIGGNGGFIETSGKKGFEINSTPDISALAGTGGEWLIDPFNLTIIDTTNPANPDPSDTTSGFNDTTDPFSAIVTGAQIEVFRITDALMSGDVTIKTALSSGDVGLETGNIIFNTDLDYDGTGTTNTLTLNADGGITFALNSSIFDSNNTGDSLNVNLFANNDINMNNTVIITQGGNFNVGFIDEFTPTNSITPTSFTNNGTIDTSGIDSVVDTIAGGNAGDISITVSGAFISTGLTATGGLNDPTNSQGDALNGANGGNISINANSVVLNGIVDSSGSAARYDTNDAGDNGASGGSGGIIAITANTGSITAVDLITNGGAAAGDADNSGNGGSGGDIVLTSQAGAGDVNLNGTLSVNGQTGEGNGNDGTKGNINIDGNLTVNNTFTVSANEFTSGNINASGLPGAVGNSVAITADIVISTGDINTSGGTVTAGPGQNGGKVTLTAADITVGQITSNGSNAGVVAGLPPPPQQGGAGGDVELIATDSTGLNTVILNGNIIASGGNGASGGAAGAPGTATIILNGSATGNVTINHAGAFTTALSITSNNGSTDTLTAADFNNTWIVNDADSTLNGNITFNGFEALVGGSLSDSFTINTNLLAGGSVDGGSLSDNSITRNSGTNDWVLISTHTGTLNSSFNFSNIQTLNGGTGTDTLTAINQPNNWNINGPNSGTVANASDPADLLIFSNMDNLQGSAGTDDYVIGAAGSLATIDGNGGNNSITGKNAANIWTLSADNAGSLAVGAINYIDTFSDIQQVNGGSLNDLLIASDSTNNWTVTGVGEGSVDTMLFTAMENLTGGNDIDIFNLSSAANITGDVVGGINDDIFNIADSAVVGGVIRGDAGNDQFNINGLNISATLEGGLNSDNITGFDDSNNWVVNNPDAGTLNLAIIFSGIENLTGGDADDVFTLSSVGAISETIDGANHLLGDTVDLSALAVVDINAASGISGIINVEQVIGNNTNSTLTADNSVNAWNITSANGGTLNGNNFSGFNNLNGGNNDDTFIFGSNGSISGTLDGGGQATEDHVNLAALPAVSVDLKSTSYADIERFTGNNSASHLIATNTVNNWNITGTNTGNVNGITFVNFNQLSGGSADDSFTFGVNGAINGTIDGAGHTLEDSVNLASLTAATVNLNDGSYINIESFSGNNSASTLIAEDNVNNWNITGSNIGTVDGISFTGFNNITGGSDNDNFTFALNGSITGTLSGGGQITEDSVNLAALNTVSVNLSNGSYLDIERFTGNNTASTITASNSVNNWIITGSNNGNVNGVQFVGFNNLTGGNADDTFNFGVSGSIAGIVNGGGQTSQDTVELSALTTVNVDLSSGLYLDIERFIGNNKDSTLSIASGTNNWNLVNINEGGINGIEFIDFNHLTGGNGADTFNVSGNGALTGQASGGLGDDIANITLTGDENGRFNFNGGGDSDTVNLIGGNAAYLGQYQSDAGGLEQLTYIQGGNSFSVDYAQVETVNDSLSAASLTVNGTSTNDTIQLGGSLFIVNNATAVNHTGNIDLIIDGLSGSDAVTAIAASTVSADTLSINNIDSVGSTTNQLAISVDQIELNNISGDVFIDETNQISIAQLNNLGGSLTLTNQNGDIRDSAALITNASLQLNAQNGNIQLDNSNQLSGQLSLIAVNGDINLNNTLDTQLATVTAQNLSVSTSADITDTAGSQIQVGNSTTLATAGSNITLDGSNQAFGSVTVSDTNNLILVDSNTAGLGIDSISVNGNASLTANGNVNIRQVSAGGIVNLSSVGAIIDSNGDSDNIIATTLTIASVGGIGSNDAIETRITSLDATNSGSGEVNFDQTGAINLVALQNAGSNGDINFVSTGDINFNPGSTLAALGSGDLIMSTTRGSFLGLGSADINSPDITAQNATFIAIEGTFGTFDRSLMLNVPGSVLINTRGSFEPQFVPPGPDSVTSTGIDFTVIGAVSAVAGEQLVEIESLSEVDPAIFTALRNFSLEDISIRMPRDQLYDDELEENASTQ